MGENQSETSADNQTAPPKRGGRRAGAGRKRGVANKLPRVSPRVKKTFNELWKDGVLEHGPAMLRAYFRGGRRGDPKILLDFGNRVMGRPRESIELSGPGGTPLLLQTAAPVALALMSTEELRALASLQTRLGLPDIELLHPPPRGLNPPDEPAHDSPALNPKPAALLPSALPLLQPISPSLELDPDFPQNPASEPQASPGHENDNREGQDDAEPSGAAHVSAAGGPPLVR
jgi:hypothetical protein